MVDPKELQQISIEWIELNSMDTASESWESAVQLKLAAQALVHAKNRDANYPPLHLDKWDLPMSTWSRLAPMPYKASREFDWNLFNDQISQLKSILND